ncbi:enoyl-CoA hydratase/isomerase family protein [Nocardioides nitrophenolicus]|uniref:enoyl-CoA hydratase/isomerase family protein n=1 Tax=Nocardioides nitrophenolicus TaxID=60489 RepID=UPI0019585F30|nr:enoyl-CoA hydratase/isomerase family protein [Nocardioides nitrophenolicus]MBM7517491.1 enoyl-CoA hydratase/carnithine racemase [Nocardioides nitrophenolicus]
MSTTLTRERDGRVARVGFDHAERGNCFDEPRLSGLVAALEEAAADPRCALIRLDMAGRHFCGGWDTSSFGALATAGEDQVAADLRATDEALDRIRRLPVPVVAAVRGQVIGFGLGLLSAVHLPVAGTGVRASLPEARFGFAPAGVGHTVSQALPRAQAYALLTGATSATAADLHRWGLIAQVVADDGLDAAVDDLVETLMAVPGDTLRAVTAVVESSRATGRPAQAYLIAARTIVRGAAGGEHR